MTSQRVIGCGVDLLGLLCASLIISSLGVALNAAILDAIVTSEMHGCHHYGNKTAQSMLRSVKPSECKSWFSDVWPGYGATANIAMYYSCMVFSPVGHILALLASVTFFARKRRVTEVIAMLGMASSALLVATGLALKAAATQKDGAQHRELSTLLKCFIAVDTIECFVVLLGFAVCICTENKKNDEYD